MRILHLVHGYPPREAAGTEEHTRQLVEGLRARGHEVHVVAATRAPGRRAYAVLEEDGVTRIVNNVPTRSLARAERDAAVDERVAAVARRFRPDVVHVQHLQFLSASLRFDVPVVGTLHDAWAWCAAGGTLVDADRRVCPGPDPARCAPCASRWRPVPGRTAEALLGLAGVASRVVAPERLHRLYQRLPAPLRARIHRDRAPLEPPAAAARRNASLRAFYASLDARIAPSAFLAAQAEAAGLGPVTVVPHGVPSGPARVGGGPLLFLGTLAWHKGPDLVVDAWRRAFPAGDPGLELHGPIGDPQLVRDHPVGGPLDRAGVRAKLARAAALVMGSRWPENAPLVALEARAAGCPVVAPAIGGLPELIAHGVDGRLYPPGDRDALAAALRAVIADPPRAVRPPPTHDAQVSATEAVYRRVLR